MIIADKCLTDHKRDKDEQVWSFGYGKLTKNMWYRGMEYKRQIN